ncbi:MAG: HNH endonuclease family protein [Pseudobdellovibrionaceae bacterium]
MRILKRGIIFFIFFGFQVRAHAVSVPSTASNQDPVYHQFITIPDQTPEAAQAPSFEFSPSLFLQTAQTLILNLLNWTLHNEDRPLPTENYMRVPHFGRWINDPTDDSCMNTRAKVLVRDSEQDVNYRNDRKCVVAGGKWLDPYSNATFLTSQELQIDHMVPLKNAYMAGAWQWDYRTRCLYANYMGYRHHLIPTSVRENTSKGDRDPSQYLPSENSYRCQYVRDWLTIKLIWNLNMTSEEARAIGNVITTYNCPTSDFAISVDALNEQRRFIYQNLNFCLAHNK